VAIALERAPSRPEIANGARAEAGATAGTSLAPEAALVLPSTAPPANVRHAHSPPHAVKRGPACLQHRSCSVAPRLLRPLRESSDRSGGRHRGRIRAAGCPVLPACAALHAGGKEAIRVRRGASPDLSASACFVSRRPASPIVNSSRSPLPRSTPKICPQPLANAEPAAPSSSFRSSFNSNRLCPGLR